MSDVDRNVQPVRIALPDGNEADVALKAWMPDMYWLVVAGVARYQNGRVVGERHIQKFELEPGWLEGHSHRTYGEAKCYGFVYDGGRFVSSDLVPGQKSWSEIKLRGYSLDWSGDILRGLLDTDSSSSVFAPDGGAALRRARLLRGTGAVNELLVDAALCQALDNRLAATED